jgi:CRP-like cAMP-binding protein
MAHDRIGDDTLPLTHEFLSLMLDVHRPGVTDALNGLREQRLISYTRGQITVRNRKDWNASQGKPTEPLRLKYRRLIG